MDINMYDKFNTIIDKFVGDHIIRGTKEISIITGDSQKMKDIVNHTIKDYDITGREDWFNPGKIILDLT